jgi:hypothetical protein
MEATELRELIYDNLSEEYQKGETEGFVGLQGEDKILVVQDEGNHYVVTVTPLVI